VTAVQATGIGIVHLDRHDPTVLHLLNEFRRSFGMQPGGVSDDGSQWHGLLWGDRGVVVVFADRKYGGTIFVDNICPARGRFGVLGTYAVLGLYRDAVDVGYYREVLGAAFVKNEAMKNAMRRVFGDRGPVAEVYQYKGKNEWD
jgi:hypothetical protein